MKIKKNILIVLIFAGLCLISANNAFADAPIITGAVDITAEATSSLGAFVTFSPTATDATSSIPVICLPESGSLFGLGTTTINCIASNSEATTTAIFNVAVVDTTSPIITPPADQTFATSTFPAFPELIFATATDTVEQNPIISYEPKSFSLGTTTITWTATDGSGNSSATTSQIIITDNSSPVFDTATIAIRDNGKLIGPFTATLPAVSSPDVNLSPTGATTTYAISARSVLAVLSSIDIATSSFDITDLQYFSSFNSFIVNCIFVAEASSTPDCFNWTYAVNGVFPYAGMDKYNLQNGDTAYIIFGSEWRISTNKSAVFTDEPFMVTVEKYDPSTGLYIPVAGEISGAVQFDSNFTAMEFATSTTDASGNATLNIQASGIYNVGISSNGYFPNISITVSAPAVNPPSGGNSQIGGGGGGNPLNNNNVDVSKAFQFLSNNQEENGSFGFSLYTDWVAIAFGAGPQSLAKDKIISYLKTASDALSSVTDYERHAMALMSLGINPYNGTPVNYIKKITEKFDGTQIGDSAFVNDDIFAIFPLIKSGYTKDDLIINKIITFIISKQKGDGSWEESVDLTASAIQALSLTTNIQGTAESLNRAKNYLKLEQKNDAGFGNSFSTSWVLQAISALGEPYFNWIKNNFTPNNYLYSLQQSDGGLELVSVDKNTRVWATAYAISSLLGKTWSSIMSDFSKPTEINQNISGPSSGGSFGELSTTTNTTSTLSEMILATSSLVKMEQSTTTFIASVSPKVEIIIKPKPIKVSNIKVNKIIATTTTSKADFSQTASVGGSNGGKIIEGIKYFFARLFKKILFWQN